MFKASVFLKVFDCASFQIHKYSSSTIFALSSGLGKCGVAVIRVSGPKSGDALKAMTDLNSLPQPRTAIVRSIKHPLTKEVLDRGIVLWFPGPKSYTGEDSCEFHVHGGIAIVNGLLDALGTLPKMRLAEPGEFTKKSFLNSKLDLTEVEGLADLLQAETEVQRKQALLQAHGSLSRLYKRWTHTLLQSVAHIEAHIDFEETETLDHGVIEFVIKEVEKLHIEIKKHLGDGRKGELLRNGVKTVILGEPNVGKSSLLNLLCQRPAAIVTPISGTTRDVIEVTLDIGGYPMVLSDTAGLRNTSRDLIEIEGMSRTVEIYKTADLVILIVDFFSYFHWCKKNDVNCFTEYVKKYVTELGITDLINKDSDSFKTMFSKNCIVVLNKIDLDKENICKNLDDNVLKLSCKSKDGISNLVDDLAQHLKNLCGEPSSEHPSMNQIRHKQLLTKCKDNLQLFLKHALSCKSKSLDFVIMAEYLRKSLRGLGKLQGRITTDEVLDVIFKDFCIGK